MADLTNVYVALLNEGTSVWRPVQAMPSGANHSVICGNVPQDEEWQFVPGQRVRCEHREFQGQGEALVAVEAGHV